jgi:glycosyltransferase involved in cell wall biosynthesis
MRIVMTVYHGLDPRAGVSGATVRLAEAYRDRGHDVQILSSEDLPRRPSRRIDPYWWFLWVAARLRTIAQGVDVVDANGADGVVWGTARRALAPRPLFVGRTHGLLHVFHEARDRERSLGHDETTRQNRWNEAASRALVRRSLRSSDLALFLNAGDRDYAVDRLAIPAARTAIVPNGVSDDLLGLPVPTPRQPAGTRVAWLGGYDFRKGTAYAEAALAPLLRDHPEVTATFLGVHRSPAEIKALFPAEVADRVEVVPAYERAELASLLADVDVLLLPSTAEGFSLALVEAMACGVAPVATRVGAAAEVVRDGRDGVLVAPRDADGLLAALTRLVADRGLLDSMRASAHARAQEYTWQRAADANLQAYSEAIERRGGGA